jgi:hypothetical protein
VNLRARVNAPIPAKEVRTPMGILSDFFGPPSEDQADRDIDRGHAEPRNDAEQDAAMDYCDEALETGIDPLENN